MHIQGRKDIQTKYFIHSQNINDYSWLRKRKREQTTNSVDLLSYQVHMMIPCDSQTHKKDISH